MTRRFDPHRLRPVHDLAGFWDFAFLGDIDLDAIDPAAVEFDDVMAVPGAFDATPRYAHQRGVAAYRKTLALPPARQRRLVIDGLHHLGIVYANGQELGTHCGGYTRFSLDFVTDAASEENGLHAVELIVLADNRIDFDRCPLHLDYFDWYHYGGITRGVELHTLAPLTIEAVRADVTDLTTRAVDLSIDYRAFDDAITAADLTVLLNDELILEKSVALDPACKTLTESLSFPDAALWTPDAPALHMLDVRLTAADHADDLRTRIGLRTVRVEGEDILINDQPTRLLGFCRHEAHPHFGPGLPDATIVTDLQLIKDLGCNFIRGAHYPQDSRFLDLCDELGICVWNEAIGWQQTGDQLEQDWVVEHYKTNAAEMVASAYNHPSVIMWGCFNEGDSNDERCRPAYAAVLKQLRDADPTRPVTYASYKPDDDVCFDLADIISINQYPGWYDGHFSELPDKVDAFLTSMERIGAAGKPIIVSEIGGGAIYGWRDQDQTLWSEQYQAHLLDAILDALFVHTDRVAGVSLWQLIDCRTTDAKAIGRPRAFNNKGILDEYRRPKQAYHVVKQWFQKLKKSCLT